MIITNNNPIKINVNEEPGSTVRCSFMVTEARNGVVITKDRIDLNVSMHTYFKEVENPSRVDLVSSNVETVFYDGGNVYKHCFCDLVVPYYNGIKTESYVIIMLAHGYRQRVILEDIEVKTIKHVEKVIEKVVEIVPEHIIDVRSELHFADTSNVTCMIPEIVHVDAVGDVGHDIEQTNKIIFVSTWATKCGIAMYTDDLIRELENIDNGIWKDKFIVNPIMKVNMKDGLPHSTELERNIKGKIIHLQHEFGILPAPPKGMIKQSGKVIITFHTIPIYIGEAITRFERDLDVVAYIVPCSGATGYINNTARDIYVIPLGSKLMEGLEIDAARERLARDGKWIDNRGKKIGFVFGFQSANKGYDRLIKAARNTGVHLLISGSVHGCGYVHGAGNDENVTILGRHLDDEEIDLFAQASDMILFDYVPQEHYSASSALHRTVGAGRPIICVDTWHFNDIRSEKGECLKYETQAELENCIRTIVDNAEESERLSREALAFAKRTSREEAARMHLAIYSKFGGL